MRVQAGVVRRASTGGRLVGLVAVTLALLLTVSSMGVANAAPKGPATSKGPNVAAQGGPPVTVMTRHLYLGSELGSLFVAQTPEQLVTAASRVWANVLASDFPARAKVLAAEVGRHDRLLIGLQEVSLFTTVGAGATIQIDLLDILLDAFADAGLHDEARAVSEAFEGTLPAFDPGEFFGVQQAQELLAGPLDTDLPVVLLGGFNSNADHAGVVGGVMITGR